MEAGEESEDRCAGGCLELFEPASTATTACSGVSGIIVGIREHLVAGAEIRFLLLEEEFGRPRKGDVDAAVHDGVDFLFHAVERRGGGFLHLATGGQVRGGGCGGGERDEDGVRGGG